MESVGFRQFARQSPNHLALAAPDGRHWSRGELLAECDRLAEGLGTDDVTRNNRVAPTMPNSAGVIALALAFELDSPPLLDIDPPGAVVRARSLMHPLGIQPEQHNVYYCVPPLDRDEAMSWALASLHYGHPVVLAKDWKARRMLRDIERYSVTTCYLSSRQIMDLLSLPADVRRHHDLTSIRYLMNSGAPCQGTVQRAMFDWWGTAVYERDGNPPVRENACL